MISFATLENKHPVVWVAIGLLMVSGIGILDLSTGRELGFSLFYLIPVVLATWFAGTVPGLAISGASAVSWFLADDISGQVYSNEGVRFWNAAIRLGFFVVVTLLLPALKELEREKKLARIDDLTGADNRRRFFEVAQAEIERSHRYKRPFALIYFDLDNFKAVNDQFGHRVGDQLLRTVVVEARRNLRKTDSLVRLGGDEFAALLPETGLAAAKVAVDKLQSAIHDEMQRQNWPVTVSIGVLTCVDAPGTADDLIRRADDLMYSAKRSGKNAVAFGVYPG